MEILKFQKTINDAGRVCELEIGGMLVLENAQQLQKEFLDIVGNLEKQINITINDLDEIDISCVQLLVAFFTYLEKNKVKFQIIWNITEDQYALLENVGISNELYISNLYV
jgi:anti-anti-sigma regulatory factor